MSAIITINPETAAAVLDVYRTFRLDQTPPQFMRQCVLAACDAVQRADVITWPPRFDLSREDFSRPTLGPLTIRLLPPAKCCLRSLWRLPVDIVLDQALDKAWAHYEFAGARGLCARRFIDGVCQAIIETGIEFPDQLVTVDLRQATEFELLVNRVLADIGGRKRSGGREAA